MLLLLNDWTEELERRKKNKTFFLTFIIIIILYNAIDAYYCRIYSEITLKWMLSKEQWQRHTVINSVNGISIICMMIVRAKRIFFSSLSRIAFLWKKINRKIILNDFLRFVVLFFNFFSKRNRWSGKCSLKIRTIVCKQINIEKRKNQHFFLCFISISMAHLTNQQDSICELHCCFVHPFRYYRRYSNSKGCIWKSLNGLTFSLSLSVSPLFSVVASYFCFVCALRKWCTLKCLTECVHWTHDSRSEI